MLQTILSAQNLKKTYYLEKLPVQVLKNCSISITKGEFLALYGPSGSGKSTLLSILGVSLSADSGKLAFLGEEVSHASENEKRLLRRTKIGFIFQSFNLLEHLTALDNVAFSCLLQNEPHREATRKAKEILIELGLEHRLNHFPAQLSGGEKQRVAIARAIVHHPALVIADEPTGSLDRTASLTVVETLKKIVEDKKISLIVATHAPLIKEYAHKSVILVDGQIET